MVSDNESKQKLRVISSDRGKKDYDIAERLLKEIDTDKTMEDHMDLITKLDHDNIDHLCDLYFENKFQINELFKFLESCTSLPTNIPSRMLKTKRDMLQNIQKLIYESQKNFNDIKSLLFDRIACQPMDHFGFTTIKTDKYIVERYVNIDQIHDVAVRLNDE